MSIKRNEKTAVYQSGHIHYSQSIPEDILERLPEEAVEQYYLWDQVIKKEIELYPWLLFPLLKEAFHREYPMGTEITLLATEYIVREVHEGAGSTLSPIYADITVRVGRGDTYHLECQMNREKGMVLRMLEYDIHIGLTYGVSQAETGGMLEVCFPRSVLLYLYPYRELPAEEKCRILFADGTSHEFRVPVVAVQQYSPQTIADKHLDILIPFLPARFRPRLKRSFALQKNDGEYHADRAADDMLKKDLTDFVGECMIVIGREKENGTLTDAAEKDMVDLLSMSCAHLLKKEPELNREVQGMMLPRIHLLRDDINELESKKERLENENERLENEKEQLESENEQLENAKEQLESENEILRQRIEELEKLIK